MAAGLMAVAASVARGDEYSASTHFYAVEYLKPVRATGDLSFLNVTVNRKLDAATAERVLREELQRVVSLFPPKGEIMAHAWSQTDPSPGSEEMILLTDGSEFLIYLPKTKQTQTEKQYDVAKQRPAQPGKEIHVELTLRFERGADGQARVLGTTNLPHRMLLMLVLRRPGSNKYLTDTKFEVADGRIVSPWLSDAGKPLAPGTYEVEVGSPLPDLQPPEVRAVIGKTGENLLGPVSASMGSKMIEYKVKLPLK
ncbi:MAG TPA: hypothetical protein VLV16_04295 [Gemmatimonadales bacterium]|nr:hypothetical protein [Gemmatimonadales bacterium]